MGGPYPLAAFTAPRVDYSLHRLSHYTGTEAEHFQNFVIFTNYAFYVDEFSRIALQYMADGHPDYEEFVEPGGGTVVFPRLETMDDATPFVERLMRDHDTAVVPGRFFQAPRHFRLGFSGETAALRSGLEAIGEALDRG